MAKATAAVVDGNSEDRRSTVSLFNGPAPEIETFDDPEQESELVAVWVKGRIEKGVEPHEIGVFIRSPREFRRARNAIKQAGVRAVELSDSIKITPGKVSIGAMHLAKGLEEPIKLAVVDTCPCLAARNMFTAGPPLRLGQRVSTSGAYSFAVIGAVVVLVTYHLM